MAGPEVQGVVTTKRTVKFRQKRETATTKLIMLRPVQEIIVLPINEYAICSQV